MTKSQIKAELRRSALTNRPYDACEIQAFCVACRWKDDLIFREADDHWSFFFLLIAEAL